MDNDTIKTIIMAISAAIALASLIYSMRKNKSGKNKPSVNGDNNFTDTQIIFHGDNNTIDQSKSIVNHPAATPAITQEQADFIHKKTEAGHMVTLVLLPSALATMATFSLSGYFSLNSSWVFLVSLIGHLLLFNALKYKMDRWLDKATVVISKLTFLNPLTLVFFDVDLENKQHFSRIKNLIMMLCMMLICLALLAGLVSLLIFKPPTFSLG